MIAWLAAGFLVVGFLVLAGLVGLVDNSKTVVAVTRHSLGVIRDPGLSDDAKETALQKNAKQLFGLFFVLAGGSAAAVLLPLGVVWAVRSSRPALARRRLPGRPVAGVPDRQRHPRHGRLVLGLRQLSRNGRNTPRWTGSCTAWPSEPIRRRWRSRMSRTRCSPNSLPRARSTDPFSSRQFPAPARHCCWNVARSCRNSPPTAIATCRSCSSLAFGTAFPPVFARQANRQKRAHGDGMLIDFDSPEALEEVLWKTFWRRHYRSDRILPWQK